MVSKKYPFASQGLRIYCGTATDDDLPIFWKELATILKHEGPSLLQQLLNNHTKAPSSTKVAPIITLALYKCLSKSQFGKCNADDLIAGLSPFLIIIGEEENAQKAEQQMLQYSMLHSGHLAPTMNQLTSLVVWAPSMPSSTLSMLMTLQGFATLFNIVHGVEYKKSRAY
jgi:hypothetical protein